MCFHFPIDMCTCVHVYTCRPGPWSSRFLFIKKLAGDSLYLNTSGKNDPAAWLRTITFEGLRDMGTWEALDRFSGQEHRSTSNDIICSKSNAHMIHAPAPRVRLLSQTYMAPCTLSGGIPKPSFKKCMSQGPFSLINKGVPHPSFFLINKSVPPSLFLFNQ